MGRERLKIYANVAASDQRVERQVDMARPAEKWAEVTPGGPPYRLLWCRITSGSPGNPPDERYYGDEVRPAGVDSAGHVTWEAVPDGLQQITIHNVAEAVSKTHFVPEDTIVRTEERLDRRSPPEMVYLAEVGIAATDLLARIVSYAGGAYTVQPVRRESGGFVDDGDPITGVPNLGELWSDEAGYLAGPSQFDRYVRIFMTPAGWTILLHPPRMV